MPSIVKEKRKGTDRLYAYEYTSYYVPGHGPKTKKRYLGSVDPVSGDIIPSKKRKKEDEPTPDNPDTSGNGVESGLDANVNPAGEGQDNPDPDKHDTTADLPKKEGSGKQDTKTHPMEGSLDVPMIDKQDTADDSSEEEDGELREEVEQLKGRMEELAHCLEELKIQTAEGFNSCIDAWRGIKGALGKGVKCRPP